MLFPKCDFFGTPCIKVQIYLGLTCFLISLQSAETTRFLGFGSTHSLGWRTGPGSSSQPLSSEGMGVMSGELSSLTNMVLEKTQFMVNLFNLPSILLFFILLLGPTIILVPALSFLRNWLSFESTEKQKMINLSVNYCH